MADANARYNIIDGLPGAIDPSMFRTQLRQPNALYDGGPVWENNHAAPMQAQQRPSDWAVRSGIAEAISPTMGAYGMGNALGATSNALMQQDWAGAAEAGLPLAMAMFPMWGRPKGSALATGDRAGALSPHPQPAGLGSSRQGQTPAFSSGPQGQAYHTNSQNALLSDPYSTSVLPDHLRQAVEAGQVPDGWYVHGRNGANNLRTDAVIQATRDLDVADQYAGKKGSGWLLQPSDDARVADFSDGSYDLRKVAQLMMSDYRKGLLPHDLQQAVEKPSPGQFHDLARGFAPEKIVDSAQWFDNPDVAQWLHDRAKVDFAKTPDGAVVLNPDAITAHQYFTRSQEPAVAEQPKGIRAYHGSPHDFDKFDASKIGTGEGAQAYGHGLYFAENEKVAKLYRDNLKDGMNVVRDPSGKPLDNASMYNADPGSLALRSLRESGDFETARSRLTRERDNVAAWRKDTSKHDEALAELNRLQSEGYKSEANPGRMYEVNIKADPEHFLDWDKPLSQQSEKVRSTAAANVPVWDVAIPDGRTLGGNWTRADADKIAAEGAGRVATLKADLTGERLVKAMAVDPARTTQALREAGIPGIKYLDQGSRGAGEGSRNYVVFDPATIEIMRKYGLLGPMAGGVAAGALQQSPNALYGDQ